MTDKEKYNNLSSIDINSLSTDELKVAIHEWAEGDEILEKLLWNCYNNGVETKGCHSGAMPYIDFSASKNPNKIKNMISDLCDVDGFSVLITPDGGNPFSGDVFYKPALCLVFLKTEYEHDGNEIFSKLSDAVLKDDNPNNLMADALVDLYSFFSYKESELCFRVKYDNGIYRFSAELSGTCNHEYYDELFKNAELQPHTSKVGYEWVYESNNLEEFGKNLVAIKDKITNGFDLELPHKIENNMSFNEMFRILRRKYIKRYGDEVEYRKFSHEFDKRFKEKRFELLKQYEPDTSGVGRILWDWVVYELQNEERKLESRIRN